MTAFLTAASACEAFATALNEIGGRVTQPIEGLEGVANDAYDDAVASMASALNISADDLMTASEAAATQDTYDAALMKAPSPDDVEAAQSEMEKVKVAAVSGSATPDELLTAVNECARIKGERDTALEQHTTDTTSTVFPKSMTDELGGPGSTPGGGDIESIEPGGGITQGADDGDEVEGGAFTGEEGVPVEDEPEVGGGAYGDNTDNPPTSTSPISSDPTPSRMGSNSGDPAAPARTELSTDGGATMTPQAGGLSTPQAQAQPYGTSPAGQPAPVTGAGNMLSNNQQPRSGSNPQQRSRDNNGDRRDDDKMSAGVMNALLAPVAAPAGGVPAAAPAPAMSSPGTAPSGAPSSAPTSAPAPAAATPPGGAPAGNPATGGAPVGGMMGSGNAARAQQQAMAPKPADTKPVISQELLDRAAELSKDGKPTDDTGKKAS